MYYLYLLHCADGTIYTGITTDLKRRVREHNGDKRGARYTRVRQPVVLVWSKRFKDRSTATKAELVMKKLPRASKLKLIQNRAILSK